MILFSFFFMCLAIRGNGLIFFFEFQQAKNKIRIAKMDPKIDTFGHIDTHVLAILVVKKSISGLYENCSGVV